MKRLSSSPREANLALFEEEAWEEGLEDGFWEVFWTRIFDDESRPKFTLSKSLAESSSRGST